MSSEAQMIDGVEVRPIPNTKGLYSITRDGRVRSHPRKVPTENGAGGKSTRLVAGKWLKTHSTGGVRKATLCIDGEPRHLNVGKILAELWGLTRDERSLLLYFETCEVDQTGAVDSRRMNKEDFAIAHAWNAEGFVRFGRVKAKDLTPSRTHWVELSEKAWEAAHRERRARAKRIAERRTWDRNPPTKLPRDSNGDPIDVSTHDEPDPRFAQ